MRFSVIVPIYRVEAYLSRCVESILAQSFRDFEAILVDDGSPDGCGGICDRYAAQDGRVRVIHKENAGLVSARQTGIRAAEGEYIVHVDGDDWVAPDMLERAERLLCSWNPDVISFPAVSVAEEKIVSRMEEPIPEGLYDRDGIRREIWPRMLMAPDMSHMLYYQWGKIFRRELVLPIQLAVDPGISLGEDVTCLMPVYRKAERVFISAGAPVYFYRIRSDSDSGSFRPQQYRQLLLGLKALEEMGAGEEFEQQIHRYASFMCFGLMAAQLRNRKLSPQTRAYMNQPELRGRLKAARFVHVTPKMRVTYFLFRRNWLGLAYGALRLCGAIKGR